MPYITENGDGNYKRDNKHVAVNKMPEVLRFHETVLNLPSRCNV